MEMESLYAEFHERERRSKNLLIYGIEEDTTLKTKERLIADKQIVTSIITEITGEDCVVSTMRLGENHQTKDSSVSTNANKPRPIKVVLHNADAVIKVLKNKNKYKGDGKIGADRTMKQREYLRNLISQLNTETDKGVNKNKSIKYINGVPKIVDNKRNDNSNDNATVQEN
ncbi:hypothetical protein R5R35_001699 [Gryllus longicercus]|uniref:Uncharacterized protein n=1 Tax=Gryllus longicercus TaxID=2509291 RepID=A0AAN9V004_9ORTH